MKQTLVSALTAFAFLLAGATYAAQDEAPKGGATPAQETTPSTKPKEAKKPAKKKCPEGQVYNKQDKKCVAKAAKTNGDTKAPASNTTPAK
jgi:hypothetical protein